MSLFNRKRRSAIPSTGRFWEEKPLHKLTPHEWERLCDTCGKCCLHKLQTEDGDEIFHTNVACQLLDLETGRCADYRNRRKTVPDCVKLTYRSLHGIGWLPSTCAYRLLSEGQPLPPWHPLETGRAESVAQAGMSVQGRAISETDAEMLEDHIVTWDDL